MNGKYSRFLMLLVVAGMVSNGLFAQTERRDNRYLPEACPHHVFVSVGDTIKMCAYSPEEYLIKCRPECCVYDPNVVTKLNLLLAVGVVNPAVEWRLNDHGSMQFEAIGMFYLREMWNTERPLMMGNAFLEYRHYFKETFKGFYLGPDVGWGVWKMNRQMVPGYQHEEDEDIIHSWQMGCNVLCGLSAGLQFTFGKGSRWGMDINWAIGGCYSWFDSFTRDEYYHYRPGAKKNDFNFLPLYKGGIFLTYKF